MGILLWGEDEIGLENLGNECLESLDDLVEESLSRESRGIIDNLEDEILEDEGREDEGMGDEGIGDENHDLMDEGPKPRNDEKEEE